VGAGSLAGDLLGKLNLGFPANTGNMALDRRLELQQSK
jgi:hypothetical protein